MTGKKVQIEEEPDHVSDSPQQSEESYSNRQNKKKQPIKKAAKPPAKAPQPPPPKKKEPEVKTTPKKQPEKSKAKVVEKVDNKDDKKKDFLPGQKYPTPEDEDGALAFYRSLYEKNHKSDMARRWCLDYGALQPQEATKLFKELAKAKK